RLAPLRGSTVRWNVGLWRSASCCRGWLLDDRRGPVPTAPRASGIDASGGGVGQPVAACDAQGAVIRRFPRGPAACGSHGSPRAIPENADAAGSFSLPADAGAV